MDFGYIISPSSHILMDDLNLTRFKELQKLEPDVAICMACGSCTATCTAGNFIETSLRQIILMLQRAKEKEAVEMLSHCMLCGKCQLVCPRGINTRHLLHSITNIYSKGEK